MKNNFTPAAEYSSVRRRFISENILSHKTLTNTEETLRIQCMSRCGRRFSGIIRTCPSVHTTWNLTAHGMWRRNIFLLIFSQDGLWRAGDPVMCVREVVLSLGSLSLSVSVSVS
ncbi:hypothetical protein SKAU_G00184180, partial [Synaphobranchus kaupii]